MKAKIKVASLRSTKIYNGRVYVYYNEYRSQTEAKRIAKELRKKGFRWIRLIRYQATRTTAIYYHPVPVAKGK